MTWWRILPGATGSGNVLYGSWGVLNLSTLLHNLAVAGALAFSADVGRCPCGRFPPMHRARRWNTAFCYWCMPADDQDRKQEVTL